MDYSSGTNLIAQQWEELRNPSSGSFRDEEEDAASIISNIYWSENSSLTTSSKTKILKYGHKSSFLTLKLKEPANGKKVTVKVYADNEFVKTREFEIKNESLTQKFEILIGLNQYIVSDADDIVSFSAIVSIPKIGSIKTNETDELKVHAVIFIPEIMTELGWIQAAKCQEEWFNEKSIKYPWDGKAKINFFNWDLAYNYTSFKTLYDENKLSWKSVNAINELRNMINEMEQNGELQFPVFTNQTITFNCINNNKLVSKTSEPDELNTEITFQAPLFEKYYFQSYIYEISKFSDPIGSFYGAIANCSVRFTCNFSLNLTQNGKIEVTITEVAPFIRNGFDFNGSQWLGFWSFTPIKSVSKGLLPNSRLIDDKSYENYRKASGKGGAYYQYSTFGPKQTVNYKFLLD